MRGEAQIQYRHTAHVYRRQKRAQRIITEMCDNRGSPQRTIKGSILATIKRAMFKIWRGSTSAESLTTAKLPS